MRKPHLRPDPYRPNTWICTYAEKTKFCTLLTRGSGNSPAEAYENCIKLLLKRYDY